jgi:hypothetical protein
MRQENGYDASLYLLCYELTVGDSRWNKRKLDGGIRVVIFKIG